MSEKNIRMEEVCIAVIAELIRRGYLEWKGAKGIPEKRELLSFTPENKTSRSGRNDQEKQGCRERRRRLEKRIIMEKDMRALHEESVGEVCIGKSAILTDLAKEYADKWGMAVYREEG